MKIFGRVGILRLDQKRGLIRGLGLGWVVKPYWIRLKVNRAYFPKELGILAGWWNLLKGPVGLLKGPRKLGGALGGELGIGGRGTPSKSVPEKAFL